MTVDMNGEHPLAYQSWEMSTAFWRRMYAAAGTEADRLFLDDHAPMEDEDGDVMCETDEFHEWPCSQLYATIEAFCGKAVLEIAVADGVHAPLIEGEL